VLEVLQTLPETLEAKMGALVVVAGEHQVALKALATQAAQEEKLLR
jgi:hypothetical protein